MLIEKRIFVFFVACVWIDESPNANQAGGRWAKNR